MVHGLPPLAALWLGMSTFAVLSNPSRAGVATQLLCTQPFLWLGRRSLQIYLLHVPLGTLLVHTLGMQSVRAANIILLLFSVLSLSAAVEAAEGYVRRRWCKKCRLQRC